jgi:5-methylthioadenosine/S-adenosylhomocysteine deaminase
MVDLLLTNATVLTMDERFAVHRGGAVAIQGDSLTAVGPEAANLEARETIDCGGRVVMPGLVNAHTHVPMSLLRGLADDLRLDVWLMGYMMPVEREFVRPGVRASRDEAGLRRDDPLGGHLLRRHVLLRGRRRRGDGRGRPARLLRPDGAAVPLARCDELRRGLARARAFIERWKGHPLIVPGPAPHAPYTTTPEILRACADLAAEFDVPLHIHLSETALEVETRGASTGCRSSRG